MVSKPVLSVVERVEPLKVKITSIRGGKMKKLILNMLVVIVLLMALSIATGNIGSPANFAGNSAIYLDEDPNEPGPESGYIGSQINCLDEDPNDPEPGPESV
jgi:hypothetical protein